MNITNITIVGNGAIGSHNAIELALSGKNVTLVGNPESHLIDKQIHSGLTFSFPELKNIISKVNENKNDIVTKEQLLSYSHGSPIDNRIQILLKNLNKNELTKKESINLINKACVVKCVDISEKSSLEQSDEPVIFVTKSQDLSVIKEKQDFVISALKAQEINTSLANRISSIPGNPTVVIAANGLMPWVNKNNNTPNPKSALANLKAFQDRIGSNKLASMVLQYGVSLQNDTHVFLPMRPRFVVGNVTPSNDTHALEKFLNIYSHTNAITKIDDEIAEPIMWKLATNMVNGAAALFDSTCNETATHKEKLDILSHMVAEVYELGLSIGLGKKTSSLFTMNKDAFVKKVVGLLEISGHHKPSTLQDINKGRTTEKDFLLKALCELGKENNVPTPVIEKVFRIVSVLEDISIKQHEKLDVARTFLKEKLHSASKESNATTPILSIDEKEIQRHATTHLGQEKRLRKSKQLRILFVCNHNASRSIMSSAFAQIQLSQHPDFKDVKVICDSAGNKDTLEHFPTSKIIMNCLRKHTPEYAVRYAPEGSRTLPLQDSTPISRNCANIESKNLDEYDLVVFAHEHLFNQFLRDEDPKYKNNRHKFIRYSQENLPDAWYLEPWKLKKDDTTPYPRTGQEIGMLDADGKRNRSTPDTLVEDGQQDKRDKRSREEMQEDYSYFTELVRDEYSPDFIKNNLDLLRDSVRQLLPSTMVQSPSIEPMLEQEIRSERIAI